MSFNRRSQKVEGKGEKKAKTVTGDPRKRRKKETKINTGGLEESMIIFKGEMFETTSFGAKIQAQTFTNMDNPLSSYSRSIN